MSIAYVLSLGLCAYGELNIGKTLPKLRILISDDAHTRDPGQRFPLAIFNHQLKEEGLSQKS
jgi:hypothetical protein